MTYSDTQRRGTLRYRLLSASLLPSSKHITEPGLWGHEYVRHLASELGEEFRARELGEDEEEEEEEEPDADAEKKKDPEGVEGEDKKQPAEGEKEEKKPEPKLKPPKVKFDPVGTIEDLRSLADECAKFLLHHNAEPDAVDLLQELEIVGHLVDLVDDNTYSRVCQYMIA